MSIPYDVHNFLHAIHEAGEAHDNDYNDGLDGWFGFHVYASDDPDAPDGHAILKATWQPGTEEGDAGPEQVQHFYLTPFDPEARKETEGKHERD